MRNSEQKLNLNETWEENWIAWLVLGALGFKSITRLARRIFAELKVIVRTGFLEAKGCLGLRVLSAGDAFAVGSWTPLAYKKITGVGHIDHIGHFWRKATSGIFNTSIVQDAYKPFILEYIHLKKVTSEIRKKVGKLNIEEINTDKHIKKLNTVKVIR